MGHFFIARNPAPFVSPSLQSERLLSATHLPAALEGELGPIRAGRPNPRRLSILLILWETVPMATKRTKAEEEQRRSEQLEKKSERRPEQETSNEKVPQDISRAA